MRLQRLWHIHAPLTLFTLVMAGFTLFFIVGIFADSRVIMGQPAWLKPTKFGLSISIYTLTIVWMLGFIRSETRWVRRLVRWFGWIVITVFIAEMIPITLQVVRGTTSHFNVATPFDAFLWSVMAVGIVTLWFANFLLAGILLFQRFEHPAFGWSLRLGLIVTIIGMGQGFLMTSPTAQQMAGWEAGDAIDIIGAHTVGAPDGGPGIPGLGWRTDAGDLRVGHFIGMHGLQFLPFVGWFLSRRRRLSMTQQTGLVWIASGSYLGLTVLVTWQALRAEPIVAPGTLTMTALSGLIIATVTGVLLVIMVGRPAPHSRGITSR